MEHLQENRMVHSDIRPSLIGVPIKRDDNFRLLDRLGDSSSPNVIQMKHIQNGREIFVSPELFKGLMANKKKIKYNPFKSDIFSLGLVILEAGIFQSVQAIYDRQTGEIRKKELINLVEKFIEKYPEDYILQETLMIMLEFSPKLRQEPNMLLKSIRKMEKIAKEKGEAMVSQINYHKDALVNQVEFTESGYKLKDSGKVQYSFYHRYEGNLSSEAMNSDEMENEIKESLVRRIKDRGSQIGLKKNIEKVQEDLEGEISREISRDISNKVSLKKNRVESDSGTEPEQEFARNTLERMILDNVGIDLSTQQTFEDIPKSQNEFKAKLEEEDPRNTIKIEDLKQQNLNSSEEKSSNDENQVEEIEIKSSNDEEIVYVQNTDTLTPEYQSLINSVNKKKNTITNEIYADFDLKKSEDLMSSREFITKENAGPREVMVDSEGVESSDDGDYAREYELYDGKVEPLLGKFQVKLKESSQILMSNNKTISKKELDNIIEDKIDEIIQEEIEFQKKAVSKKEVDEIIEDKINEIINEEISYQQNKKIEAQEVAI
jgi:serine/threonine protein kinase